MVGKPAGRREAFGQRVRACANCETRKARTGHAVALCQLDLLRCVDHCREELVLVDSSNATIDAVRYDDARPWPVAPDSGVTSLQRICASGVSESPENWSGREGDAPTPLAENAHVQCPAPLRPHRRAGA